MASSRIAYMDMEPSLHYFLCEVKIWQRNMRMHLIFLRRSELQLELHTPSLFLRIQGIFARLRLMTTFEDAMNIYSEFQSLRKEVEDAMNMDQSSILTADEILGFCHCNLDSLADLLTLIEEETYAELTNAFEVRDAFEVHARFLISFLRFGMQASSIGFHYMLSLIQPIAIDAARLFIKQDRKWCKHVESKSFTDLLIDPQVYQVCSQALNNISPSLQNVDNVVLENFLDSLISLLWDMLRRLDLDSRRKHQFKVLYERLRFWRAFLKNGKDEKKILDQIGALICHAGALICSPLQADLSDLLRRFDAFQEQVEPETNSSMANEELSFGDFTNINISNDGDEKRVEIPSTPRIDGFQDDELTLVLDRLMRGSKHLSIVPICGMAGLGKVFERMAHRGHS